MSRKARTTARRAGLLASEPARTGGLAGRSRSCLRGRSTRSGNLRSGGEEAVRAGPWVGRGDRAGRRAREPAGEGNSGKSPVAGLPCRAGSTGKAGCERWSCSLPAHSPHSRSGIRFGLTTSPRLYSPASTHLFPTLHFSKKARSGSALPPASDEANPALPAPCPCPAPRQRTHLHRRRRARWG